MLKTESVVVSEIITKLKVLKNETIGIYSAYRIVIWGEVTTANSTRGRQPKGSEVAVPWHPHTSGGQCPRS